MENVPINAINQNSVNRRNKNKRLKPKHLFLSIVMIAVIFLISICVLFFYRTSTGANIEDDKYQAVFFTNGQVYFGKLHTLNGEYMKMTDIFYLQTKTDTASTNPQATASDKTSDVQLIKLGDEVHGPEDQMTISKDQILFFENLKKDGKVSSSITSYLKQNK